MAISYIIESYLADYFSFKN